MFGMVRCPRDGPIVPGTKCLEQPHPNEPSRRARYDRAETYPQRYFASKGPPCFSERRTLQSSNRCAYRRESGRILRDGSFEVALSQALRARLRSDRPSGTRAVWTFQRVNYSETARSGQNNRLEAYFTFVSGASSDVPRLTSGTVSNQPAKKSRWRRSVEPVRYTRCARLLFCAFASVN